MTIEKTIPKLLELFSPKYVGNADWDISTQDPVPGAFLKNPTYNIYLNLTFADFKKTFIIRVSIYSAPLSNLNNKNHYFFTI